MKKFHKKKHFAANIYKVRVTQPFCLLGLRESLMPNSETHPASLF